MNKLEKWFLRRICQRLVVQGPQHANNIVEYYSVINQVARKYFYEDNHPTLSSFLSDCHARSTTFEALQPQR